jgi:2-iminobutanoate/2-iminopropanoate deaminase
MKMFDIIQTTQAPQALGPYSQATITDRFVFLSGQIGLSPATGELVGESIDCQITQIFCNIQAILTSAGLGLKNIIKLTVFINDLADFSKVNEAMTALFSEPYPARSTVQVSGLPKNAAIEIEAIALR